MVIFGQQWFSSEYLGQHCAGKNLVQFILYKLQEAADNIAQEKILFNNVVMLLGQHCIVQAKNLCNVAQQKYCTGKNPVQYRLNNITFWRFSF